MLFQFTWIGLLIDCIIKKRLLSRLEVISLMFLLSGTVLAAGILDVDLSQIPWQGWGLGFAAAVSFASFLQVNSRPVTGVTTIGRTFILATVALIIISIFQSPEILWNETVKCWPMEIWNSARLIRHYSTYFIILLAASKVGGALVSILSAMELPVAIIVSVIVLNEALTLLQVGGIVLVLIGVIFPSYFASKRLPN